MPILAFYSWDQNEFILKAEWDSQYPIFILDEKETLSGSQQTLFLFLFGVWNPLCYSSYILKIIAESILNHGKQKFYLQ